MNWVDYMLLALLVASLFMGMRTGLIETAFVAVGALIGWQLAGQFADDIGAIFEGTPVADTWVTVISYFIIIVLTMAVVRYVAKFVKPVLTVFTVGLSAMVDKLGGLALGLIMGLVIVGAVIILLARFTYDFELPQEDITSEVTSRVPQIEETRKGLENSLVASIIVPVFIDIADAIPGNALGFVPSDFKASLDVLQKNIDGKASS